MNEKEEKVVVFPETLEEWNALSTEEKVRLLFHDVWLGDVRRGNLWYHYTTVDALASMITTDGVEMWATQCQFLNDRSEIKEGINFLRPMIEGLLEKYGRNSDEILTKKYINSTFLSCLTTAKESIPMWNTYAQFGNGIALGFQPHIPSCDDYKVLKVIYRNTEGESKWIRETTRLAESSNSLDKTKLLSSIAYLPLVIKNKAFEYEDEIRLICESKDIYFRSRKGLLVPYKKFKIDNRYLREIIIGPANDADRMHYAIELLLKECRLDNVSIKHSAVPLRN